MPRYTTLRLILGDQLHIGHSWFAQADPQVLYVIAELRQETDYVRHHVQKICAFFAAMERFAGLLGDQGHQVLYLTLDETGRWQGLPGMIQDLVDEYQIQCFEYQRPDEYRVYEQLESLSLPQQVTCTQVDSEHFLVPFKELDRYFRPGSRMRMESFYRRMRSRFDILMDGEAPLGGRWNFDTENRQRLRADDIERLPRPLLFANDVSAILERLRRQGVGYLGTALDPLPWPVDRQQSLQLLEYFCQYCLPFFGRFQDAMTDASPHKWSLYHSRLSFALNCKLLSPLEVVKAVLRHFEAEPESADIAQVEGFIRQIMGWREFVRGIYWANMPAYATCNSLQANGDLPDYFWTAKTKMRCMNQAIGQSLEFAYAHHIQRLMVTGNFCLLTGIDPDQVDDWYLGIYIDALQWVEMPNTRGMSQYADGGLLASKPYAASGNYINRMSDYCSSCEYQVKEKTGDRACPFNSLYWHFMTRHREQFSGNPRIGMIYRSWDRMSEQSRSETLARAAWLLENLGRL